MNGIMKYVVILSTIYCGTAAASEGENAREGCNKIPIIPNELHIQSRYIGGSADPHHTLIDRRKFEAQRWWRLRIDLPTISILKLSDEVYDGYGNVMAKKQCIAKYFYAMAKNRSLEGVVSSEDYFYRDWELSTLGLAYLKSNPTGLSAEEKRVVQMWLTRLALSVEKKQDVRIKSGRINNHFYWANLALVVIGQITGDVKIIARSEKDLRMSLSKIDDNGFLMSELERGNRALHYHVFSAVPLGAALLINNNYSYCELKRYYMLSDNIFKSLASLSTGPISKKSGIHQINPENMNALFMLAILEKKNKHKSSLFEQFLQSNPPFYRLLGGGQRYIEHIANAKEFPKSRDCQKNT